MKDKIFLLIGTVFVLMALILYNPNTPNNEEFLADYESGDRVSEYCIFEEYGFNGVHIYYQEQCSLIELETYNYDNLEYRFEEVIKALATYGYSEVRIWLVNPSNHEEVKVTYENGIIERY